jgi:hypothetical protein
MEWAESWTSGTRTVQSDPFCCHRALVTFTALLVSFRAARTYFTAHKTITEQRTHHPTSASVTRLIKLRHAVAAVKKKCAIVRRCGGRSRLLYGFGDDHERCLHDSWSC